MSENGNTLAPQAPASGNTNDAKQQREDRRSAVRVIVTYIATGFLFVVGAAMVGYFIATGEKDDGKDIFLAILPIASAVITYWFAGRQSEKATNGGGS